MAKRRKIPTPSWEHSTSGTLAGRLDANRWQLFATGAVLLLVIAAIGVIGWAFLSDYIEDERRPGSTALEVVDREYTVRDFGQRVEMYVEEQGGQNQAFFVIPTVSNLLVEEAVLLQFAETEEGITVTEDDIRAQIALNLGIQVSDPNFDARFQEELQATGLTEEEYRDLAKGRSIKGKLTTKFQEELPESLPAVHIRQISVATQETADDIVSQLEDGADFASLYVEHSQDYAEGDETGGDEGFVPEGVLPEDLETFIFGLEDGDIRVFPTNNVFLVVEKLEEAEQPPTDDQKSRLAANAYSDWYAEKRDSLEIRDEMDFQTGDPDKISWVIDHAGLVLQ
ncbi:MAG TPA: SurA N-terminal domain-containing protein [Dehalococcoidia bacterium]|nr:SurA N-terminal domain-containing protein [Dehalococcoidia bacterium]